MVSQLDLSLARHTTLELIQGQVRHLCDTYGISNHSYIINKISTIAQGVLETKCDLGVFEEKKLVLPITDFTQDLLADLEFNYKFLPEKPFKNLDGFCDTINKIIAFWIEYEKTELLKEKERILKKLEQGYWFHIREVSPHLKKDREIFLKAVELSGHSLLFGHESLRMDRALVIKALKSTPSIYKSLTLSQKQDVELACIALLGQPHLIEYAPLVIKKNKEIALKLLGIKGSLLQYFSLEIQNDEELVWVAIENDLDAIRFAASNIYNHYGIALFVLSKKGAHLDCFSQKLRNEKSIALAAVQNFGWGLQYLSEALRKDKEVVLAAVRQNGLAFLYAEGSLKQDREIAFEAIKSNWLAIQYVEGDLQNDQVLLFQAIKKNANAINLIKPALKQNPFFLLGVILLNPAVSSRCITQIQPYEWLCRIQSIDRWNAVDFSWNSMIALLANMLSGFEIQMGTLETSSFLKMILTSIYNQAGHDKILQTIDETQVNLYILLDLVKKFLIFIAKIGPYELIELIKTSSGIALLSIFELKYPEGRFLLIHELSKSTANEIILTEQLFDHMLGLSHRKMFYVRTQIFIESLKKAIKCAQPQIETDAVLNMELIDLLWKKDDYFKDSKKQVALFHCLSYIIDIYPFLGEKNQLNVGNGILNILSFQYTNKSQLLDLCKRLHTIAMLLGKEAFARCIHYSIEEIDNFFQEQFIKLFRFENLLESQADLICLTRRYFETFATFRQPLALFHLFSTMVNQSKEVIKNLQSYIYHVLNGDFFAYKYLQTDDQPHLEQLYQYRGVKEGWIKEIEPIILRDKKESGDYLLNHFTVEITSDPQDLLLLGTEVQGSCLSVFNNSNHNKALFGYLINGDVQAIVLKDRKKRIQARAILRLLQNYQGRPVLFIEKIYANKHKQAWLEAIVSMAKAKAISMMIPLYSAEPFSPEKSTEQLIFKGSRAAYVFSDAAGDIYDGQQEFIISKSYQLIGYDDLALRELPYAQYT